MENVESLIIHPNVYYTVDETAHLLRVSQRTVRQLLRTGKAHGIKIGKQWRILGRALLNMTDADEYIEAETVSDWMQASMSSLRDIWDNEEDALYDQL